MQPKILIIEDDPHLCTILDFLMRDEGYEVSIVKNGEEGLEHIRNKKVDLVLLDLNLPGMSGLEVCNRIKTSEQLPVIILSCRDKESDVISGLETGAEDYLRKPFNHRELILRIKKLLKLYWPANTEREVKTGDLVINKDRKAAYFKGSELKLTPMEYKLLEVLGRKMDWVMSWQLLLREAWGYKDWVGGSDIIKVNIRRLRLKIEPDPSQPLYLLTERGWGYKLAKIK